MYHFKICADVLRKATKDLCQDTLYPTKNFDLEPLDHKGRMLPISLLFLVSPELSDHTQYADVVSYCQAHTMRGTVYIKPLLEFTKPAHLSRHCFSGILILQMDPNYLHCDFCRYLQQWMNLYSSSYKRVCSWIAAYSAQSLAFIPML